MPSTAENPTWLRPEITTVCLPTARIKTCINQVAGREKCEPILLIHGTAASSAFFFPLMQQLPRRYRPIAIDLRGFGATVAAPIDAGRGMRDFSDDVLAVADALGIERFHVVGWSLGGAVAMQAAIDGSARINSLTLLAPVSPLGFGGLWNNAGEFVSVAGSGGGLVARQVVEALRSGSPASESGGPIRGMLEHLYTGPDWDEAGKGALLDAMFSTAVGDDNFPGSQVASDDWPGFGPGTTGLLSAMAPANLNLTRLVDCDPKPPILWVRGDKDKAISDTSSMDPVYRARKGAFGGIPEGADLAPQPMVTQTRTVLDGYVTCGGTYREVVLAGVGHSPHLENIPLLLEALIPHLDGAQRLG